MVNWCWQGIHVGAYSPFEKKAWVKDECCVQQQCKPTSSLQHVTQKLWWLMTGWIICKCLLFRATSQPCQVAIIWIVRTVIRFSLGSQYLHNEEPPEQKFKHLKLVHFVSSLSSFGNKTQISSYYRERSNWLYKVENILNLVLKVSI